MTNPDPVISGSDTLTYDGTDQFSKFTLTAPSGTVDVMGKAFNISGSASTVGWSLVTQVIKDAGTYTVTASHTDGRTIQKQVTVNKATSSIAFNDYPLSYTYTTRSRVNPTADQLTLTGAGYNDVTFTWYKGSVADANKLDSAPADAGSYYLVASISESNNTSGSSTTSGAITVNPKEVSSPTIELSGTSFEYTGSEIRPEVVSVKDGETVIPASEYTVEYANTTNVGDNATVTIVDKDGGNYTVNGSTTFQITKASATVTQAPTANTLTYNGSAQELVTEGTATGGTMMYSLDENNNFSANIPTATDAGDYTVWYKVVGDANHSDTQPVEVKITIAKAMPSVTDVQVSDSIGTIYDTTDISTITLTYTGSAGTVKLTEGQTLHAGSGTYTWTFTPADTANYNNATGTITLTVAEDTVQSIAVTTPPTKTTYTYGESLDITGMVVTATYASGATKPVTADMTVTPTELTTSVTALTISYGGKTTIQAITVNPKAVNNPTITLSDYSFEFTGKAITPTVVSVKDGETVIPAGEYTVSYSNNVNVGTNAALTITDKAGGNYTVSGSTTFEITKVKATVTKAPTANTLTYTGQPQALVTAGTATGGTMQYSTEENGTYDTAIPTGTNVGSYSVWYKVAGDANHSDTDRWRLRSPSARHPSPRPPCP